MKNTHINRISLIFGTILLILIGIVAYFNRWIFVYKFEPEYWENYYYESQWNIPNSKRVISDEGVYRYIGFRLVNGENPFNVDYWVPPLGKYCYGFSAKYFQNPYLMSFFFYLLAILIFGLIAREMITSATVRWLTIYLFALNPLLVEQIQQTMLDLPLTVFLMLNIYFLFRVTKTNSFKFIALSGISLGLMAGIKPAYFVPMIALVSMGWLFNKTRNIKTLLYFIISIGAGYVLSYFCYFIKHPNPIPWIRLHQKIIDFQKNNAGSHDWISIFRVIFLDKYKGYWVGAKTIKLSNWSLTLPIGVMSLIYVLFKNKKIKDYTKILFLSILGMNYIFMNLVIDFWPRYLMPLIPILTLSLGFLFKNKKRVLVLLLISLIPSLYALLFPSSSSLVESFNKNNQAGFYRETYRALTQQSREKVTEKQWIETNKNNLSTTNVKITPVKENNQWKIDLD